MPESDIVYSYQGQQYTNIPLGEFLLNRLDESTIARTFQCKLENKSDRLLNNMILETNIPNDCIKIVTYPITLEPGASADMEFILYFDKIMDSPDFPQEAYIGFDYRREFFR